MKRILLCTIIAVISVVVIISLIIFGKKEHMTDSLYSVLEVRGDICSAKSFLNEENYLTRQIPVNTVEQSDFSSIISRACDCQESDNIYNGNINEIELYFEDGYEGDVWWYLYCLDEKDKVRFRSNEDCDSYEGKVKCKAERNDKGYVIRTAPGYGVNYAAYPDTQFKEILRITYGDNEEKEILLIKQIN